MNPPIVRFSNLGELAEPPVISEIMKVALENKEILSLAAGFTDTQALPAKAIRDISVSLATSGKIPEYLQYGTTMGRSGLRKFISKRLSRNDQHPSQAYHPENIMLTNGSQQALYLAMQVLCDPGDIVFVESPSYFVFLELLKGLGIQAVGIPVDENDEIDGVAFAELIDRLKSEGCLHRIKGIYLESWYSNPSTRCLTDEKKAEVARVLNQADLVIPVLEDGAYFELYFEERFPSVSIFANKAFDGFPRLFFGTFTKPFATGLKVGYVLCDHSEILSKMASIKGHHDFGTSNFAQAIIEKAVEEGVYDSELSAGRGRYLKKMRILEHVMQEEGLPELGWHWTRPSGGMFFWLKGPVSVDTSMGGRLFENAVKEGVIYVPGDLCFAPGGPKNYMRVSFGVLEHHNLVTAGQRLAKVLR
jgi:2-aminoadipate transaminase